MTLLFKYVTFERTLYHIARGKRALTTESRAFSCSMIAYGWTVDKYDREDDKEVLVLYV